MASPPSLRPHDYQRKVAPRHQTLCAGGFGPIHGSNASVRRILSLAFNLTSACKGISGESAPCPRMGRGCRRGAVQEYGHDHVGQYHDWRVLYRDGAGTPDRWSKPPLGVPARSQLPSPSSGRDFFVKEEFFLGGFTQIVFDSVVSSADSRKPQARVLWQCQAPAQRFLADVICRHRFPCSQYRR